MSIFLLWSWSKLKIFDFPKKTNSPYILELMEYLVWRMGEMMECVLCLFILQLFGGPSWCDFVLSTNQPIFMWEMFASVAACTILMLQYHMMTLLFSRWWEGAWDRYVFIGRLLLIGLKNHWPDQNRKSNPKLNTSFEKELQNYGT